MKGSMYRLFSIALAGVLSIYALRIQAQGVHFSQFYNTPLLNNPANTGFINEEYRLGVNYRTQWTQVPVPFKSFSAFSDLTVYTSSEGTGHLAMGFSFMNDNAGDGNLSLTKGDFSLAYHVNTNDVFYISAGLSAGYGMRSVDYNKLSFDVQWDGFTFDKSLPNGEQNNIIKTNYFDIGAGLNFGLAVSPAAYITLGGGVAHLNQPTETFYNQKNQLNMRPTAYLEAQLQLDENFMLSPSVLYTTQRGASEINAGTLVKFDLFSKLKQTNKLVVGGYYRLSEAFIGVLGFEYGGLSLMYSYDYTQSGLGKEIKGKGASEFSLIYKGFYIKNPKGARHMGCENPNQWR